MVYGYINSNNEIEIKGILPTAFKNVSGFNNLPEKERNKFNWYNVVNDDRVLEEWERVDSFTYLLDTNTNKIIQTKNLSSMTLDEYKDYKYNQIQVNARDKVNSKYSQDQKDSLNAGFYPPEVADVMKAEMRHYFDEVYARKQLVYNSTTYQEVKDINVEVV